MKQGIHPDCVVTTVTCTCGNTFETRPTVTSGEIRVDACSACHPFHISKQKILGTGGRVVRFEAQYGKHSKQLRLTAPATGSQSRRRRRLHIARVPPAPVSTTPSQ